MKILTMNVEVDIWSQRPVVCRFSDMSDSRKQINPPGHISTIF